MNGELSPVERGQVHVQKLKEYLEGLKRSGDTVPMKKNGEPHRTAIAKACGLPRGFLYTNKTAVGVLNSFLGTNSDSIGDDKSSRFRGNEREEYLEQQLLKREQELATCKAGSEELSRLLAEAEAKLARYQLIEDVVIKAGRRIIP